MIGTLRRELLDRVLVVNERHLRRILAVYLQHFNTARPHRTLAVIGNVIWITVAGLWLAGNSHQPRPKANPHQ
jgi:hypothetical protein